VHHAAHREALAPEPRRDVALARAADVFWKQGYDGTSLDDLAAATGMNRPSLYAAFGDKRALYLKTLYWSAIICSSASVGVTLVAHDMVRFVLGEKWLVAEPLVGWLALSAGLLGLSSGAYTAFDALGKAHLGARMQWVRLFFLVAAIVPVAIIAKYPPEIAATRLVVTAVFMPTLFFAVGREVGVSWRDYLRALWRPFVAAATMAAVIYPLNLLFPSSGSRLVADILLGALSFGLAQLALWWLSGSPDSPEKDVIALVVRHLQKRRR